jgi:selenide,water dikinase
LRRLSFASDPRVLVGSATADDAGVFRLDRHRALVQTVDFFTPVVDDARSYGQIAAANALSDVYAMGGRPLTGLNILGVPQDVLPPQLISRILAGGAATARQARCAIVGGHTIKNPEPIYGLAVTGLVHPRRLITNAAGRPGDLLVLTKPLGTGIVTTAIKRDLCPPALARQAIRSMRSLNVAGALLAERGLVRAGTDITGFGLLGHLGALCRASGVGAELYAGSLPMLGTAVAGLIAAGCVPGGTRANLASAQAWTESDSSVPPWQLELAADAQTSGGLLLCVPPRRVAQVLAVLEEMGTASRALIGALRKGPPGRIKVRVGKCPDRR